MGAGRGLVYLGRDLFGGTDGSDLVRAVVFRRASVWTGGTLSGGFGGAAAAWIDLGRVSGGIMDRLGDCGRVWIADSRFAVDPVLKISLYHSTLCAFGSDLAVACPGAAAGAFNLGWRGMRDHRSDVDRGAREIGRASCRERVSSKV